MTAQETIKKVVEAGSVLSLKGGRMRVEGAIADEVVAALGEHKAELVELLWMPESFEEAIAFISEPGKGWEPNPLALHLAKAGGYAEAGLRFGWETAGQLHDLVLAWVDAGSQGRKMVEAEYKQAFKEAMRNEF